MARLVSYAKRTHWVLFIFEDHFLSLNQIRGVRAMEDGKRPTIMITNDDGIDAPGLRALVQALVSTNRYNIQVCAPDRYPSSSFSVTCWEACITRLSCFIIWVSASLIRFSIFNGRQCCFELEIWAKEKSSSLYCVGGLKQLCF